LTLTSALNLFNRIKTEA